jgi:hypothetical protein
VKVNEFDMSRPSFVSTIPEDPHKMDEVNTALPEDDEKKANAPEEVSHNVGSILTPILPIIDEDAPVRPDPVYIDKSGLPEPKTDPACKGHNSISIDEHEFFADALPTEDEPVVDGAPPRSAVCILVHEPCYAPPLASVEYVCTMDSIVDPILPVIDENPPIHVIALPKTARQPFPHVRRVKPGHIPPELPKRAAEKAESQE